MGLVRARVRVGVWVRVADEPGAPPSALRLAASALRRSGSASSSSPLAWGDNQGIW